MPHQRLHLSYGKQLKSQDFFRQIIARAVAKRLNLFQISGSPAAAVGEATEAFGKVVQNNLITPAMNKALIEGQANLWRTWLASMCAGDEKEKILTKELQNEPLSPDRQEVLGNRPWGWLRE